MFSLKFVFCCLILLLLFRFFICVTILIGYLNIQKREISDNKH